VRLGEFITSNIEPILKEWEAFARSILSGTRMERPALRDDAESILRATVRDMASAQTLAQQASKSKGHGGAAGEDSERLDNASTVHGVGRVGSGFNLVEVVSEYRALRASVLRLWRQSNPAPDIHDIDDITRFNESIDQSLAKAVVGYTHRVDQARRMFLAILAHDLRNPLNGILLTAKVALHDGSLDPRSSQALTQIETTVQAMDRLINDLIDFACTGLGAAMPLALGPMNLQLLCREVIRELRSVYPKRQFDCDVPEGLTIVADAARLRQVLSNLLGNAVQHGSAEGPITVSATTDGPDVVLSVGNTGPPIPAALLPIIFDPLVRGNTSDEKAGPGSLGLGLYIVREIVTAHGGSVSVRSTRSEGTSVIIRLPRHGAGRVQKDLSRARR
jgi:signal transduction histidine kinase